MHEARRIMTRAMREMRREHYAALVAVLVEYRESRITRRQAMSCIRRLMRDHADLFDAFMTYVNACAM